MHVALTRSRLGLTELLALPSFVPFAEIEELVEITRRNLILELTSHASATTQGISNYFHCCHEKEQG